MTDVTTGKDRDGVELSAVDQLVESRPERLRHHL